MWENRDQIRTTFTSSLIVSHVYFQHFNPKKGGSSELQIRVGGQLGPPCSNRSEDCFWLISLLLPLDVWSMKFHVAWEHSSFKILDLVAIQKFYPRALNLCSSKFWHILIFSPKIFRGLSTIVENDHPSFCNWSQMGPFWMQTIILLIKNSKVSF